MNEKTQRDLRKEEVDRLTHEYLKKLTEDDHFAFDEKVIQEVLDKVIGTLRKIDQDVRYPNTDLIDGSYRDLNFVRPVIDKDFLLENLKGRVMVILLNEQTPSEAFRWVLGKLKKYNDDISKSSICIYDERIKVNVDDNVFYLLNNMEEKSFSIGFKNKISIKGIESELMDITLLYEHPYDDLDGDRLSNIGKRKNSLIIVCSKLLKSNSSRLLECQYKKIENADIVYLFEKDICTKIKDRRPNND